MLIMIPFHKLYEAFKALGFEDELDMSRQASPNPNKVAAWTGEDCGAVIIGIGPDKWIDFIFDENLKFDRVRIDV
jgi:hypothetical protein